MSGAREAAFSVLLSIENDKAYSNLSLDTCLKKTELSKQDAGLTTMLVYGVIARRLTLDYFLSKVAGRPIKKIQPPVRIILRIAVYQMLFMEKIPARAAVNEAVLLAKRRKLGYASGFINGVLRNFSRKMNSLQYPDQCKDALFSMEVQYSCPQSLISFWQASYGKEAALAILEQVNAVPPVFIRVNTLRISTEALQKELETEGVKSRFSATYPQALQLLSAAGLRGLSTFQKGLFFVQGLASQMACEVLAPKPGETVFDFCAAPGGKSFNLALLMEGKGTVQAFDLYEHRVQLIQREAHRLGLENVICAKENDAAKASPLLGEADRVLCDVPCSGLGVIRRKPEIRYKELKAFDGLPDLQYHILCEGAMHVRKGGTLVYSTCTLNPAENEEVLCRFLDGHADFALCPFEKADEGSLTLFPQKDGVDGFFIAKMRRC
ncbi:MAG TPA: 16S rRNA (cytosine(967)-C(5))-methyltransferase RsmB [Ruminococcaceae bacterium]|nr:16S rRNA (cytosine(967)-C(5))-methyltransferase RsmB [Oscillospiraceae bacterium]